MISLFAWSLTHQIQEPLLYVATPEATRLSIALAVNDAFELWLRQLRPEREELDRLKMELMRGEYWVLLAQRGFLKRRIGGGAQVQREVENGRGKQR